MKLRYLIAAVLLSSTSAMAAHYVWTGAAGDGLYGTSENWTVNGSINGYTPQSYGDTALIATGDEVIWTSSQWYYGATDAVTLSNGSTLTMISGGDHNTPNTVNLQGDATFIMGQDGAFGLGRALTLNYGSFTQDAHGLFSTKQYTSGCFWSNSHTITMTGEFDTTGLEGADSIVLAKHYDGSGSTPVTNFTATGDNAQYVTFGWEGENYVARWDVPTPPASGGDNIPEPTTATLSLLALAGLAARRRRK